MLGIVVLIVAVLALRQPSNSATSAGSTTPRPSTSTTKATKAPSKTPSPSSSPSAPTTSASSSTAAQKFPLVVLNNTTVAHLAAEAAAAFEAGGWTVTSYANYQNEIPSTCAYFDPSVNGSEAAAEALRAQFPGIVRVKQKFSGLPAGPLVVVLTPGYQP